MEVSEKSVALMQLKTGLFKHLVESGKIVLTKNFQNTFVLYKLKTYYPPVYGFKNILEARMHDDHIVSAKLRGRFVRYDEFAVYLANIVVLQKKPEDDLLEENFLSQSVFCSVVYVLKGEEIVPITIGYDEINDAYIIDTPGLNDRAKNEEILIFRKPH